MQVINFIKTVVAEVAERPIADRLRHVIQKLAAMSIRANYDPVGPEGSPSRVLLHSTRYNARNYQVAAECNGIIIDYSTWEVVYRPPELPNSQFAVAKVAENFVDYNVYALNDGTVVGLYYYHGKWRISTARGIDMGDVPLFGNNNVAQVTYQQAIEIAMSTAKMPAPKNLEAYARGEVDSPQPRALRWDELDVDASYTVGFTHPAMHFSKFTGMWMIRAVETRVDGSQLDTRQYEVPEQQQVVYPTFSALQQACAADAGWGFMMRSRNPEKTGVNSTIIMESRRMTLVRQLVYDRHLGEEAETLGVTREHLAFTQCLLDANRDGYIQLYPERAALQASALASIAQCADEVVAGPAVPYSTAAWFKARCAKMTRAQVLDFMLIREHTSVWLRHLEKAGLLP